MRSLLPPVFEKRSRGENVSKRFERALPVQRAASRDGSRSNDSNALTSRLEFRASEAINNPMTNVERDILAALVELDNTVQSMASANPKPNLLPLFERLDQLTRELPRTTDPSLLHYLHKKSYQKARLYLEGRDAENQAGNCRHV